MADGRHMLVSLDLRDAGDPLWVLYRCSDCDPTMWPGEPLNSPDGKEHEHAFVMMLPEGIDAPDLCPRCGSYLSMSDGTGPFRVEAFVA